MNTKLVLALACALGLGGCAYSEDTIDISYKAVGGPQVGAGIKITTTVTDDRTADRKRVSAKTSGAAIRSKQDVTTILKNALDSELKARGYSLEPGARSVALSVTRFFNSFKAGVFAGDGIADVLFDVKVTTPDGAIVYERGIVATGKVEDIMLANGSNAAEALSDGMRNAFKALFADEKFIAALREPATATRPSNAPANS